LEIGESLKLNDLFRSIGPDSRLIDEEKIQMTEDLRNSNLFTIIKGKWKSIIILKKSALNTENDTL
jgi:hypothetical protein